MPLEKLTQAYTPAIEEELKQAVARISGPQLSELQNMMRYHLGWIGPGAGAKARGKRIRPILVLLTTAAAGGKWEKALPAAAGIELVHNFSLIHDDIEDNSPLRRGRPTLWKKWGIAQAVNAGDAMFSLAHLALMRMENSSPLKVTLQATNVLRQACLTLTQGQYLDISYENRTDVSIEDYWPMVEGKTATLLATCTELGALIAEADENTRSAYRDFGRDLGLAFQALDDILGIWGESEQIGKSTASDLVEGKKSLPILFALEQQGMFAKRWHQGPIQPEECTSLAALLETEGARDFTLNEASRLTNLALTALAKANPQGDAGQELTALANQLLCREI
ncbi:MAG: polyprenyl synthetase family protein [Anaerolineae bacterium]|nr:polyprenyl synthetase family protein [Anaerolineae bacterium]